MNHYSPVHAPSNSVVCRHRGIMTQAVAPLQRNRSPLGVPPPTLSILSILSIPRESTDPPVLCGPGVFDTGGKGTYVRADSALDQERERCDSTHEQYKRALGHSLPVSRASKTPQTATNADARARTIRLNIRDPETKQLQRVHGCLPGWSFGVLVVRRCIGRLQHMTRPGRGFPPLAVPLSTL